MKTWIETLLVAAVLIAASVAILEVRDSDAGIGSLQPAVGDDFPFEAGDMLLQMSIVTVPSDDDIGRVAVLYSYGDATDVSVPESVEYKGASYRVSYICDSAFSGLETVETVTLPGSIAFIEEYAFAYCVSLKDVTISEGTVALAVSAFEGCVSLESVYIPDGMVLIGSDAFRDCESLKSVRLPETLTHVYSGAFAGCVSMEEINVPASLKGGLDDDVFEGLVFYGEDGTTVLGIDELPGRVFHGKNGEMRPERSYVAGDMDGDGDVDAADAALLFLHSILPSLVDVDQPWDFNGDGRQNVFDALRLFLHVLSPGLFPLH